MATNTIPPLNSMTFQSIIHRATTAPPRTLQTSADILSRGDWRQENTTTHNGLPEPWFYDPMTGTPYLYPILPPPGHQWTSSHQTPSSSLSEQNQTPEPNNNQVTTHNGPPELWFYDPMTGAPYLYPILPPPGHSWTPTNQTPSSSLSENKQTPDTSSNQPTYTQHQQQTTNQRPPPPSYQNTMQARARLHTQGCFGLKEFW